MKIVEFQSIHGITEYVNPDAIVYAHDHGTHYSLHLVDGSRVQVEKTDPNAQTLMTGGTL